MKTDVWLVEALEANANESLKNAKAEDRTPDKVRELGAEKAAHAVDLRFDRELTDDEVRSVAGAAHIEYMALENERTAEPHAVHVEHPYEDIDPDENGKMTGRRYVGPTHCPDCGKGLTSQGTRMVCSTLGRFTVKACHNGCVIACGRPQR